MLALVAALAFLVQPDTSFRPTPDADDLGDDVEEVAADVEGARVRPVFSPSAL